MNTDNNELWHELKVLFNKSERNIVIKAGDETNGRKCLASLNISSNSVLGSCIYNSSGIIIDGWLRILGQDAVGSKGITEYNKIIKKQTSITDRLVVAYDVLGGMFAVDDTGQVRYFAPDTLEWEYINMNYSQFVSWAVAGNMDEFYEGLRWSSWKTDVKQLAADEAYLIYPFLWAKECDIEKAVKKAVPTEELLCLNIDNRNKLGIN